MSKANIFIKSLFGLIAIIIAFFAGIGICYLVQTYYHPAPVIPASYHGYYLTEFKYHQNIYDHIMHITSNHVITTNGVHQLHNQGSYDALKSNQQFGKYSLNFKVNKYHPSNKIKDSGYVTGKVDKLTTPSTYFNKINRYKRLPPMQSGKLGVVFLSSYGIVRQIKNKHIKVVVNGLRISKSSAKDIEINNSNNM